MMSYSLCYAMFLIFSFEKNPPKYPEDFEPEIRKALNRCHDCIKGYHAARAQVKLDFILKRKVSYANVEAVLGRMFEWEAATLIDALKNMNIGSEHYSTHPVFKTAMIECLICPSLVRKSDTLATFMTHALELTRSTPTKLNIPLTPGILHFLFRGKPSERNWALSTLPYNTISGVSMVASNSIDAASFSTLIIEEYERYLYDIQDSRTFSLDKCCRFWNGLIPLLRFCSPEVIVDKLNSPPTLQAFKADQTFNVVPLFQVFVNQLMSYLDKPLPILLRVLAIYLIHFRSKFWDHVKPQTFLNFFDVIFHSPHYLKYLKHSAWASSSDVLTCDMSMENNFQDLIGWIVTMCVSLNAPQQTKAAGIVYQFSVDQMKDMPGNPALAFVAIRLMIGQMTISGEPGDPKTTIDLYSKADARAIIDKKVISLFDAAQDPAIQEKALMLISSFMSYDISSLAHFSYSLYFSYASVNPTFFADSWTLLERKFSITDLSLAKTVLIGFADICKVFSVDITLLKTTFKKTEGYSDEKLRELVSASSKQNRCVSEMAISVDHIYTRLTELYDGSKIKGLLCDQTSSYGFWCCVLAPEEKIYESAVGLLYETFDVDGRFEAFKGALDLSMATTVLSFQKALHGITNLKLFVSTKRAVRILMDFAKCLFHPIHGVLITLEDIEHSTKIVLINFWKQCWKYLAMIYETIFDWSNVYESLKAETQNKAYSHRITEDLTEFTRDVLDLSHTLLNGYKILVNSIKVHGATAAQRTDIQQSLFHPLLRSFGLMIPWLRLSDTGLLVLCVELTSHVLDLVLELSLDFDKESLIMLTKLCVKAKKFNNRLSEEQRGDLLIKARKFDSSLVEKVVLESEEYRKVRNQEASSTRRSQTPPQAADNDDIQIISEKRIPSKQSSITNFMSTSSSPAASLPPPPKRMSMLEQARLQLSEKRKQSSEPLREPAAPRQPGFNKGTKSAGDSESGTDSGSESEDDGLFTRSEVLTKLKKSKLALQSLNPKSGSIFQRPKPAPDAVNLKKKAEELLRLRLSVDMNPLYNKVLSWSYTRSGEFPDDDESGSYTKIKDVFSSATDYQRTFEPLLLLECWQSIQRAKELSQEVPFRLTVGSRSATDTFFDVYASVKKEVISEQRALGDSDLVVLMFVENLPENGGAPSKKVLDQSKRACFAKVRSIKANSNGFSDVTFRVATTTPLTSFLTPSSELVGMRVMQMITIEREFSSLRGLPYYDLADSIVKAVPTTPVKLDNQQIQSMKKLYEVNDSQALAIAGTIQNDGFSLIQGPPGTGKTKTILGIIGYVLTSLANQPATTISYPGKAEPSAIAKKKILICAPSNAAVDELVLRLMGGIKNASGQAFSPSVVRLGRSDAVHSQVKKTTLEELVDAELTVMNNNNNNRDDSKIKEEHRKCVEERNRLRAELSAGTLSVDDIIKTELKLQEVVQRRKELGKRLDQAREQSAISYRNREIERRNIQFRILNSAQVVCSTLSGSAHDVLASMSMSFDTVVIDEAAQCIELSAIIPLRYGCKKCIMVGDPNQLPPTVLSQKAASFNYEQSLFVRMQKNHRASIYLLDVQYRMHPEISRFPSKEFYNSKLLDGPGMADMNAKPWHKSPLFTPYRFFDVKGKQEQNEKSKSLFNWSEGKVALEIVNYLFDKYQDINWTGMIAIISPYKEQVRLIRDMFIKEFGFQITKEIDFNTIDGFQGQEKEIVLFSCVRAEGNSIGFLADIRRMNVALTRARSSLWILGSRGSLYSNKTWKRLIEDADTRQLVSDAYPGFTSKIQSKAISSEPEQVKTVLPSSSGMLQLENKDQETGNLNTVSQSATKIPIASDSTPSTMDTKPDEGILSAASNDGMMVSSGDSKKRKKKLSVEEKREIKKQKRLAKRNSRSTKSDSAVVSSSSKLDDDNRPQTKSDSSPQPQSNSRSLSPSVKDSDKTPPAVLSKQDNNEDLIPNWQTPSSKQGITHDDTEDLLPNKQLPPRYQNGYSIDPDELFPSKKIPAHVSTHETSSDGVDELFPGKQLSADRAGNVDNKTDHQIPLRSGVLPKSPNVPLGSQRSHSKPLPPYGANRRFNSDHETPYIDSDRPPYLPPQPKNKGIVKPKGPNSYNSPANRPYSLHPYPSDYGKSSNNTLNKPNKPNKPIRLPSLPQSQPPPQRYIGRANPPSTPYKPVPIRNLPANPSVYSNQTSDKNTAPAPSRELSQSSDISFLNASNSGVLPRQPSASGWATGQTSNGVVEMIKISKPKPKLPPPRSSYKPPNPRP
ncbi:hypothetical protein CANARDRAFT_28879 [[Candida] arabinofermentans NRRL YB-2248]|uniref:UvrD-like helicase ATP-binding domain-containing protein n=1 Tax=[Candida] arabinofermentans NRRL YB-2248 TaxID=983967 RepID=A0A1E4SYZ1_9ASCO|nr:hypothetical protein CANARDRAFT_28879 [[Candida] arabinofermentans NRRL YB-2248]